MALCARTGVKGFYVAVRGSIEDLSEPKVFFTQKAEKFVKDILNVEPHHLGLKLESFIVSGLGNSYFYLVIPQANVSCRSTYCSSSMSSEQINQ
jgi:hypothetical protein